MQEIVVSGEKLSANIILQDSAAFELALDSTQAFFAKITLAQVNEFVFGTKVYVWMKAGLTSDSCSSTLSIASTGAESQLIKLTGTTEQGIGIYSIHTDVAVVSTTFYTLNGSLINDINNLKGVFIAKEKILDGTIQTKKIIK